jgi:hypothetical protein
LSLAGASAALAHSTGTHSSAPEKWSIRATIIEAVSGPWPCSHQPSSVEVACRYNRVIVIEKGELGAVLLTGAKLWMAGEKTAGQTADLHDWAVISFDPSVMLEQRTALLTIVRALYPLNWMAITVGDSANVEWDKSADDASGRLAEGSIAELLLERKDGPRSLPSRDTLRYGAAPKLIEAVELSATLNSYRKGNAAFDLGSSTGVVVRVDFDSSSVKTSQ